MICGVCGETSFTSRKILWDELISEWQISPYEVNYINRSQGEICDGCGANIRSIALANAIRSFLGTKSYLKTLDVCNLARNKYILELNEAGTLSPVLREIGIYEYGSYPDVDMHELPYEDNKFDLVIHSDTLEHVRNPIHALRECKRVLKAGGALCFTIPIIIGRLSRNREGLPLSYHGNPETSSDDYAVQTEFGADAWAFLMEAGFAEVSIYCVSYPAGIAFLARNS